MIIMINHSVSTCFRNAICSIKKRDIPQSLTLQTPQRILNPKDVVLQPVGASL